MKALIVAALLLIGCHTREPVTVTEARVLLYVRDCMEEAEDSDIDDYGERLEICTDVETMRDQAYISTHGGAVRPVGAK